MTDLLSFSSRGIPGRVRPRQPVAVAYVAMLSLCGGAHAWAAAAPPLARPAPVLHGGANSHAPGYLGIEFHDTPPSVPSPGPGPNPVHGVEIVMVDHDGPAGKAGLRPHDVIVSLNGQVIASAEALRRMIHDAGAGMQVALSVLRNGHSMTLNAQLASRDEVARAAMAHLAASNGTGSQPFVETSAEPELPGLVSSFAPEGAVSPASQPQTPPPLPPHSQGFLSSMLHSGSSTGLLLGAMEPQLAIYFGAPQGTGLLVQSVEGGSAGAAAGLRAGDVLLRADLYPLHTQADWTKRLHAAKGQPLKLSVLRERRELTLTMQTDLKHHSLLEWPALF